MSRCVTGEQWGKEKERRWGFELRETAHSRKANNAILLNTGAL